MTTICGVDGCRKGWIAVTKDMASGDLSWRQYGSALQLFKVEPRPQTIGIDIPIGLPEFGPRACEQEARRLLKLGRASSVFSAPIRPMLNASSYLEACQVRFAAEGKKISRQTWGILAKIREVDAQLCEDVTLQSIVYEVHPEVSFYFLAGQRPLRHSKKTGPGFKERVDLLEPIFGPKVHLALEERRSLKSAQDDILDAFAALWTAERIATGTAISVSAEVEVDHLGLRMAIHA